MKELLAKLEAEVKKQVLTSDPAHDFEHIMRVCRNAKLLAKREDADMKMVLAAALLHDIVSYPKHDPRSGRSSLESSTVTKRLLAHHGCTKEEIKIISDAVRDHSYSRGRMPRTLVGKVVQDADRLDAIGAIGISRAFSVGGTASRPFYKNDDPFCKKHKPDDSAWTLDHFYRKLLLLEEKMNTKSGRTEARRRTAIMKKFLHDLRKDIYP